MIELRDLSIAYQRPLIETCNLKFMDSCFTLIQGHSGTGKTSLLYRIGLISRKEDFTYIIDDKKIMDFHEKETLRQYRFGYVLQDSALFDHYDVIGNMKLYAAIAGYEYSEEEYHQFLQQVHLSVDFHQSIASLSGGERQRVAIACVLCKQPDVLILDEITSALDKENELHIFEILQELSHQQHKCVILASHSIYAKEYADQIYDIKDKQIHLVQNKETDIQNEKKKLVTKKLGLSFYLDYIKYFFQKYRLLNASILMVMCMMLTIFLFTLVMFDHYENLSRESFERLYENQLMVVENRASVFSDRVMKELSKETVENIQALAVPFEMHPYIKTGFEMQGEWIEVVPCFQQNYFDDKVEKEFSETGVYVSKKAYDLMKKDLKNQLKADLKMNEYVDGNVVQHRISIELPIKGVLKENVKSPYLQSNLFVYIPQEKLEQLYQENASSETYAGMTLLTKDYKDLIKIKNSLNEHELYYNIEFCDTQTISDIMRNIMIVKYGAMGGILLIFILMFGSFQTDYLVQRNQEMALLIVNGMNHQTMDKLLVMEALLKYMTACILSTMIMLSLIGVSNLFGIPLSLPSLFLYLVFLFLTFSMTVVLTKLYSSSYLKKLSPETVLRD